MARPPAENDRSVRTGRRHPRPVAVVTALTVAVGLAACAPAGGPSTDAPTTAASATTEPATPASAGTTVDLDVDGRTVRLHLPPGHDAATPVPLVVGLHGYTSNATELDSYFGLTAASDERGFLLALPEGTVDPSGDQFWNALEGGCCDFSGTGVDDSTFVARLIEEVEAAYAVEGAVLVGHSNGAYLAHRVACDHADRVTAIAALAGPLPADAARCEPSEPVAVLQIHGDADDVVGYGGGQGGASAPDTAAAWAAHDGCSPEPEPAPPLDLERLLPGAETEVLRYADCPAGTAVELWTITGGGHVPELGDGFTPAVLDFLLRTPPATGR